MDVIEIIAAHLAGRHINAADLKPVDGWRFGWEQNPLNVPCNFEIVIEPFFFVRHGVNDGVVESKSRLLCDGLKNDEIALRKWRAHWTISKHQHTQILISILERRSHDRRAAKSAVAQLRQLQRFGELVDANRLPGLPDAPDQSFAGTDRVQPQEALQRSGSGGRLLQDVRRNVDQRRAALGDKSRPKFATRAISHIKCPTVRVQNARGALNNEPVQFLRSNGFSEGFAQTMQEIENQRFLDLDLLVRTFQSANPPCLEAGGDNPSGNRRDKQSEEKSRPHRARASLLR